MKWGFESESYEGEMMYREFAQQAAASRFTEVRGDEMGHRDVYIAALVKFSRGSKR